MGACGCNETNGVYRIPGKNETQYIIGHHIPCKYCDSPVAITIDKLSKRDTELMDMMHLPEPAEIDGIKLIDLDKLRNAFKIYLESIEIYDDGAEIVADELIWEAVVPAMCDTIYKGNK